MKKLEGKEMLDKLCKKTREEFLGKETTLEYLNDEMLYLCHRYANYNADGIFSSCQNYDLAIANTSWGYYIPDTNDGINIIWELVKKDLREEDTIVKIIAVEKL